MAGLAMGLSIAWSAPAGPDVDARLAAAKSAMMVDPADALSKARDAHATAIVGGGPGAPIKIATAEWLEGEALLRLDRAAEAKAPILDGLAIVLARAPDSKLHGDLIMTKAGLDNADGRIPASLEGYQEAFRIFGVAKQPRSQAVALQNIGLIYMTAHDYPKVLRYYRQAAEVYPADQALLLSAANNSGNALMSMDRYPEAIAQFEQAVALSRAMGSPALEARTTVNLANAEIRAGRRDVARKHLATALALARSTPAAADQFAMVWGVSGELEQAEGRNDKAAAFFKQAFAGEDLAKTSQRFRDLHEAAYRAFLKVGDDRLALAHLQAFKRLDDEARNEATAASTALITARFDYANQSSRIAQLESGQLKRDVALARSQGILAYGLLAAALIVSAVLTAGIVLVRRSRNEARAANDRLSLANAELEAALSARSAFLASASHELRTPLNGMLGMTDVVLADPDLTPRLREKLALAAESGGAMRVLVEDLLDMSTLQSGDIVLKRETVDLSALGRDATDLWGPRAAAKGVKLSVSLKGAPPLIVGDAARLRQIVSSLLSNAVKFTERGAITLEAREADERLVLSVSDTGIGIPADALDAVFETFRQADSSRTRLHDGIGLGLSIAQRLVQAMGGVVEIDSREGEGTTVRVVLPLARAEAAREVADPEAALRMLVVEDNAINRRVIGEMLRAVGVEVDEAEDGAQGLARVEASPYDVILMDLRMPGMDGATATRLIRERSDERADVPIVIITADAGPEVEADCMGAGADRVLFKPVTASGLFEAIEEALGDADRRSAA